MSERKSVFSVREQSKSVSVWVCLREESKSVSVWVCVGEESKSVSVCVCVVRGFLSRSCNSDADSRLWRRCA